MNNSNIENEKTVLYLTDLPVNTLISDVELFLSKYKDKIKYINNDQNFINKDKKKLSIKVIFEDFNSANSCRLEMNLKKIKNKSVRIMWDEHDSSIRYNTKNNIFIKGIPKNITPREVYEFFLKFGDISSAKIIEDVNGNHYGYGYITYYNPDDVNKAIEETKDKKLWGTFIEVSHFQKKNERTVNAIELNNQKLYISNLPPKFTTNDLKILCNEYGSVQSCNIFIDNLGKNFGIVQFSSEQEAKDVLTKLDNKEINNTKLLVKLYQTKFEHKQYLENNTAKLNEQNQNCNLHIKNIPLNAEEKDLLNTFGKYGNVTSVKIEKYIPELKDKDQNNLISKGFGYVSYDNADSAKTALEALNGKYLPGFESWTRPLSIEIFMTRYERQMIENQQMNALNYFSQQFNRTNNLNNNYNDISSYNNSSFQHAYNNNEMYAFIPMNIPYQYQNQFNNQRAPYQFMNNNSYNSNNYNNNHYYYNNNNNNYNNLYKNYNNTNNNYQKGHNYYNKGGYHKNNRNYNNYYNNNNNYYKQKNQMRKKEEYKNKVDIEEFKKLKNDEDKKEYLGEKVYQVISESHWNKKLDSKIIEKITGMIINMPDHKEIIEIIENQSKLNNRIEEALSLLKINS